MPRTIGQGLSNLGEDIASALTYGPLYRRQKEEEDRKRREANLNIAMGMSGRVSPSYLSNLIKPGEPIDLSGAPEAMAKYGQEQERNKKVLDVLKYLNQNASNISPDTFSQVRKQFLDKNIDRSGLYGEVGKDISERSQEERLAKSQRYKVEEERTKVKEERATKKFNLSLEDRRIEADNRQRGLEEEGKSQIRKTIESISKANLDVYKNEEKIHKNRINALNDSISAIYVSILRRLDPKGKDQGKLDRILSNEKELNKLKRKDPIIFSDIENLKNLQDNLSIEYDDINKVVGSGSNILKARALIREIPMSIAKRRGEETPKEYATRLMENLKSEDEEIAKLSINWLMDIQF